MFVFPKASASPATGQPSQATPLVRSGGNVDAEHNVVEGMPPSDTFIDARGNVIFKDNHISFNEKPWPPPTDKYKSDSNHALTMEARKIADEMIEYDELHRNVSPDNLDQYYKTHFAKEALALSSEMLLRLGPRNWGNPPPGFESGSAVIKNQMTVGFLPLRTAAYFLIVLAHNLPDDNKGR
jgi:hypothetical protein